MAADTDTAAARCATDGTHFTRLQAFASSYSPTTFTQYESRRTGLRVVAIDQAGPKVSGAFALATEIHDDSGAPHTLEHLCFMGSRSFRYKGFLDQLATRFYSDTNAWTDTDHTAYTLDAAGWASFARILPVYLEHILAPTLADAACYTEVYHVDGAGHDAGVVYSEMQGVQHNAAELIDLRIRRLMYPEGVGYRYETGGMMEALRVLSPDRIRQFHRDMYQPRNLCLVITGQIDHADMLRVLDEFEAGVLDIIPPPDSPFERPFAASRPPPLSRTVVESIAFPDEDEEFGEVEIRFLGPHTNDTVASTALQVALLYLAGSSAAVLENTLVEREQLCTAVYYGTEDRPRTEIRFTLSSVETPRLREVEARFFEVLRGAVTDPAEEGSQPLNYEYLSECLARHKRSWKYSAESSAATFSQAAITDFVYGERDGRTLRELGGLAEYDVLAGWSEPQWRAFMRRWLVDAHHVSVLGEPSAELSRRLKREDEERVAKRRRELGEAGLAQLAKRLKDATAENEREIPRDELLRFAAPGVETIPFIQTSTARAGAAKQMHGPGEDARLQQIIDDDAAAEAAATPADPLYLHFQHIPSNFVHLTLYLSTQGVATELKPLLSVYTEAFFSLPLRAADGTLTPFETVVANLERDTVGYSLDEPLGHAPELLAVSLQIEAEKYAAGIAWLRALAWDAVFDPERVRAVTARLLSDVPDAKRSGSSMLLDVKKMVEQAPESVLRARCTLAKARCLRRVKALLRTDEGTAAVVRQLEALRTQLFRRENMRVLVVADLEKLAHPVAAWRPFAATLAQPDQPTPVLPIVKLRERLTPAGARPGSYAYIVPMPPLDSSYLSLTARAIDSWDDPRLPALMVAVALLNAVEGPLWVAVRGTGLAYGASVSHTVAAGLIRLDVWRSPDAGKAFAAARRTVAELASGAAPVDAQLALAGAISSIVVGFVNDQLTYAMAAQSAFNTAVVSGLPPGHMQRTLRKTRDVGVADVRRALAEFVLPLFGAGTANVVVTCSPALERQLDERFREAGFATEVRPLREFEDDYGLGEGVDDDDDDDEEEEGEEEEDGSEGSESGSDEDDDEGDAGRR